MGKRLRALRLPGSASNRLGGYGSPPGLGLQLWEMGRIGSPSRAAGKFTEMVPGSQTITLG